MGGWGAYGCLCILLGHKWLRSNQMRMASGRTLWTEVIAVLVASSGCSTASIDPTALRANGIGRPHTVAVLEPSPLGVELPQATTPGIARLFDFRLDETSIERPTKTVQVTTTFVSDTPVKCRITNVHYLYGGRDGILRRHVGFEVEVADPTASYYVTNEFDPAISPPVGDVVQISMAQSIVSSWTIRQRPASGTYIRQVGPIPRRLPQSVQYPPPQNSELRAGGLLPFTGGNYWPTNGTPCLDVVAEIGLIDRRTLTTHLRVEPKSIGDHTVVDTTKTWMEWALKEKHCIARAQSGPCTENRAW